MSKKREGRKAGEKMSVVLEKKECIFKSFLAKNKDKVRKLANANTARNKDGKTVIRKGDPWRDEHEWEDLYEGLKDKR